MIVSRNRTPPFSAFQALMSATDIVLNNEARGHPDYFVGRNGTKLEEDVYKALNHCAKDTPFEGTISLVSGAAFPDIVASRYYGVEVKSTDKNHWTSTGSSILESTRIQDVEHIFLTFGKLGKPVQFLSRPYQDCLSDITVTHYPRYRIDMRLQKGETIFDKMNIPYDVLRKMDNPTVPVSQYYKSQLKPGQKLRWAMGEEQAATASPILKLWTSLTSEQKNFYTVKGYALFPEILGHSPTKYQRYALWLASDCSVINTNIRDQFSAGGRVDIPTINGLFERMPAPFGRIAKNKELIESTIEDTDEHMLLESWDIAHIRSSRLDTWCKLVARQAGTDSINTGDIYKMLCGIFGIVL